MTELKKNLEAFVSSGALRPELKGYFVDNLKDIEGTVYRGLPFPLHLLRVGGVIEDWNGCDHWTLDITTAKSFSESYADEDYAWGLIRKHGEANVEFVKTILTCDNIRGVELYKLLQENSIQGLDAELEITTIDSRYTIIAVTENDGYYFVKVRQR